MRHSPQESLSILKLNFSLGFLIFFVIYNGSFPTNTRIITDIHLMFSMACLQIALQMMPTKMKKTRIKLKRTRNQNSQLKR